MCFFFFNIKEILTKTNTSARPFSCMDVEPIIENLSLFFDMHPIIPHNFDDAFEIGKLTMHNNDNPFKIEKLLVQEDGMCTNPTLNMSLENALFPFLFLHGCGAYDGISGLLSYLKQKNVYLIFCFYIISTIFTLNVPSATSNSITKWYKTSMFGKGCTKIKTPTSSMVKN
jgi:hypothetical protein